MQTFIKKKTGDILLEAGSTNSQKLEGIKEIGSKASETIEKIILSEGIIKNKEIMDATAKKMGVEFIDLENTFVNKNAVDAINPEIAMEYSIFPFDIKNNLLHIAMQNPDDIFLIDEIKVFVQMEIKPFLADSIVLDKTIRHFYYEGDAVNVPEEKDEKTKLINVEIEQGEEFGPNIRDMVSEESSMDVDEFLKYIIMKAMKISSMDIHIDSFNRNLRIRFRVDGTLIVEDSKHNIGYEELIERVKVMAGLSTYDRSMPQNGYISYQTNNIEKIVMDVFVLPAAGGEKVLIRIENCLSSFNLDEIGISEKEQKLISDMLNKKSGMVIVTGLSGNGRTTTCYSMIKKMISKELNIITIENKVALKIEGISQIQLQNKKDASIFEFVESVIAHDPDVIVADINLNRSIENSREVLKQLMNTALSGKLVIITMSFPSVFETISGLINLGFEHYTVATSIEGIIAQYLVRKACNGCRNGKRTDRSSELHEENQGNHHKKVKCGICSDIGYKGKVGIFEVFNMNKDYRKLIIQDSLELVEDSIDKEPSCFKNNCIRLINDNVTTAEEVIRIGIGKDVLKF